MVKIVSNSLTKYTTLILSFLAVIGIILIVSFLQPSSELENQFLFGLSARRFVLAGIFIFFWLVNVVVVFSINVLANPNSSRFENNIKKSIPYGLIVVYFFAFTTAIVYLLMIPPVLKPLKFLQLLWAQLESLFIWLFVLNLCFILLIKITYGESLSQNKGIYFIEQILFSVVVFLLVLFIYFHFAMLIGWTHPRIHIYWDLLAEQLLKGHLYILNPPYTHDLTYYNGNWYVPMPPLPAILLMPVAYLIGAENVNAGYFSMFFSAFNGMLLFLILRNINERKWIQISIWGIFLLVLLFLFGTPHLWVGISGRGWFVSQILTVAFLAMAIYSALLSWSPWWAGIFIAIAMTARPNSLMTWPFVFAISMQILNEQQGKIELRSALIWTTKTALPILLAIIGLLTYNYLRFENFFDFGYATINGDPPIVYKIQTWGMFSPHFIADNLQIMFFEIPKFTFNNQWNIEPTGAGMSIFITTPSLIYLFHKYPKQWWVIGAWVAIFINLFLLSLYHTTGAYQFGYRYILDMLIPLILMLSVGMSRKIPWHFIALFLASIFINLYGAYWYVNG